MYLTKRELDVCKCLIQGQKNNEIAQSLYISKHTVKAYVSIIMANFNARNRTQLAYILGKENIIVL